MESKNKEKLFKLLNELNRIKNLKNINYYFAYGSLLGAVRHKGFIPWDEDIDIIVTIDDYKIFCDEVKKFKSEEFEVYDHKTSKTYTALFSRFGFKNEAHHKIHIDIFPMIGCPSNLLARILFSRVAYYNFMMFYMKRVDIHERFSSNTKNRLTAAIAKIVLFAIPDEFFAYISKKLSRLYKISESRYLYNLCGSYGMREFIEKKWLGNATYIEFEGLLVPCPQMYDAYLKHMYGDYMVPRQY